jgi:tRNA dimethylallyltransferase
MKKILVICGPTATGKSTLAVNLAKKFNGEIISADSRQVYRGLDIGSGKITDEEKQGVNHYLLDVASPKRRYSAAQYASLAKKIIHKIQKKGNLPILCGGTGFYLQAVINDLTFPAVKPDWLLRKKLEKLNIRSLQKKLKEKDLKRWERMNESDRQNPRRLIRALEIIEKTGQPVPGVNRNYQKFDVLAIGIYAPLGVLKERIKKRLFLRLNQGMVEEVRNLLNSGVSAIRLEELGLEYRWVCRFLQNRLTKKEMIENLLKDIYDYARRQMTWFKKFLRLVRGEWFDITSQNWQKKVEDRVLQWYNSS